jgi:hypothetical protein
MRFAKIFLAITAASVLITGCARQKDEASKALAAIETSVSTLKEEGAKYAPVATQGVESTLATLKDSLAKEDYKAVLAGTPELTKAVDSLKTAIASGKEQFTAAVTEWTSVSADVPQMVEAIQSRVDILASAKKLPKNVSKEALETAKSGLDWMKSTWTEASAVAADKPAEAVEKAKAVKAKGAEILAALGMTS